MTSRRDHDPYAPHDAADSAPPAKRTSRKRAPKKVAPRKRATVKPTEVSQPSKNTMVVKSTAAKRSRGGKRG